MAVAYQARGKAVHEGSVTGPVAYRKYFGAYTNIVEAMTTSNLQAGKTYYVVPRNNGSYSANLRYRIEVEKKKRPCKGPFSLRSGRLA